MKVLDALQRDTEGYLCHLDDWSEEAATVLAHESHITLTSAHWEVIHALRAFYAAFGLSPAMRPLCKYLKEQLGQEKSGSIYLLQLFPAQANRAESPAKIVARIAGLPKPDNCL